MVYSNSPPLTWQQRRDFSAKTYRAESKWRDETIASLAKRRVEEGKGAAVALWDAGQAVTFERILGEATAIAAYLLESGLKPGDVVSYQLPNWYEAASINLAAAMVGLIVNPLVPIYRDAEIGYMLADSKSRALFIPQTFRSFDYVDMARRLWRDLPHLEIVVCVRSASQGDIVSYDKVVSNSGSLPTSAMKGDPDAIKLLLYTSGTTGRAKGVMHTHNTIRAAIDAIGEFWNIAPGDSVFMASPVSHITGYLYALEQPFVLGTPAILLDTWDAERAVELINRHGCTIAFGATPFLKELADAATVTPVSSLRVFPCGGAPVAPEVAYRAAELLSPAMICRIYGSSETAGPVAFGERHGNRTLAAETDGEIFNAEVIIRDPSSGHDLPFGEEGEILVRSPQNFVGYLNPDDDRAAFDPRNFFRTGDLGKISPPGYLVVTGRLKDLIIRGGENISPREVEDRLLEHPAVREVAVVAIPDERLGEGVGAFIVCEPGLMIDLSEASRFLIERQLAKQKIPTRIEIVEALPKTASGKIRKDLLRQQMC